MPSDPDNTAPGAALPRTVPPGAGQPPDPGARRQDAARQQGLGSAVADPRRHEGACLRPRRVQRPDRPAAGRQRRQRLSAARAGGRVGRDPRDPLRRRPARRRRPAHPLGDGARPSDQGRNRRRARSDADARGHHRPDRGRKRAARARGALPLAGDGDLADRLDQYADGRVLEDSPSWRAFTGQTYDEWKESAGSTPCIRTTASRIARCGPSAWRSAACSRPSTACAAWMASYRWTAVKGVPHPRRGRRHPRMDRRQHATSTTWSRHRRSGPACCRRCRSRTGARTNSWRCWRTSCATRWRRSRRRRTC
jgi:hypothetical protein